MLMKTLLWAVVQALQFFRYFWGGNHRLLFLRDITWNMEETHQEVLWSMDVATLCYLALKPQSSLWLVSLHLLIC